MLDGPLLEVHGRFQPRAECLRRELLKPLMYSKGAISTLRWVCQLWFQTSSAFSAVKKLSTADLALAVQSRHLAEWVWKKTFWL
jgi:hypothetical protein